MFSLSQLSLCSPRCTFLSNIVIKSQAFTVKPTLLLPNLAWYCSRKVTEKWLAPAHTSEHKFKFDEENILIYATHADAGISINIHRSACTAHIHEQKYTSTNSMAYCCKKEQNKEKKNKHPNKIHSKSITNSMPNNDITFSLSMPGVTEIFALRLKLFPCYLSARSFIRQHFDGFKPSPVY